MEAVAGVTRGGLASLSICREALCSSDAPNWVSSSVRSVSNTGASLRLFQSSASFKDQSHVQFYSNVHFSRKERFAKVMRKASSATFYNLQEAVAKNLNESKSVDKAKTLQKKAKKVKNLPSSSSSSSSSSESDPSEDEMMVRRKPNIEQLKREWDAIARSPLMNSIPTISAQFVIGEPKEQVVAPFSSIGDSCDARQPCGSSRPSSVMPSVSTDILCSPSVTTSSNAVDSFFTDSRQTATILDGLTVRHDLISHVEARVEVCMGGKCKKAGAQQVLSAFQDNGVSAVACNKCMKNCKSAINVRIQEEDTNTRLHSGIGIGQVNALSQKYFGVLSSP